tara:strand:- start:412 stop:711 length:300 start_codon:yes stop_codon:yes gene_type:complete
MFIGAKIGNIKDHYHFDKNIGSGAFGVVYLARNRETFQQVAIKAIEKSNCQDEFINECNILRKLDHPNIVNIIEIWEWNKLFFIVTDYYAGGELSEILK